MANNEYKLVRRVTIGKLEDADKYNIIKLYGEGEDVTTIAKEYHLDEKVTLEFIQDHLKRMLSVREVNDLMQQKSPRSPNSPINKCLTDTFKSKVDENMDLYAYYYVQTGDNEFALEQAGLAEGIPNGTKRAQRLKILQIRGQYIRGIPAVAKYIRDEQDARMVDLNVNKLYLQREIVEQIEQLKQIAADDSKQRPNLLKAVEMLGKTIGGFTDRVEVDEGDAKEGLDILMKKIGGTNTYAKASEQ